VRGYGCLAGTEETARDYDLDIHSVHSMGTKGGIYRKYMPPFCATICRP
jgi:hypothetical protein